MYRGFNLKASFSIQDRNTYYDLGRDMFTGEQHVVHQKLKDLLLTNGNIDGSKLQEDWFPQINNVDIFISHSHKDEDNAIILAGWLYKIFNIKSFIDSCIWGYSDELLRKIDNKFCLQEDGYYNYSKRNFSTAHVHMMLSIALNKMIDNTECLFFLNSPNSISTSNEIANTNKTNSAWIYSEIAMSKLIRKRPLSDFREMSDSRYFSKAEKVRGMNESFDFEYDIDLSELSNIDIADLNNWVNSYNREKYALDILYKQHSQINRIIG
jgi:hypothetical protein